MNNEERQLITGLFDRMRDVGRVDKDRDAENLINQSVRQMPDAPYMLVQSVLVQEHALEQSQQRIQELEDRVRQLEDQATRQAPAQQGSGSFLGGLFGGGSRPAPQPTIRGSVPPAGSGRPMGAPAGGAWGNAPGYGAGAMPQQQAGGGGGFMRSAMATAAGVAGGMLAANAISNMMKGDSHASSAGTQTASTASAADVPSQQAQEASYDDGSNDPGTVDVADDDGGDWGGGGDEMDV
jgi:hypothetical protein